MGSFIPNIDNFAFSDEWLNQRMLFIAGPRQVGKTSYAKKKIEELKGCYFNWDDPKTRSAYRRDSNFFVENIASSSDKALVVFDEIHKYGKWKNILKGIFDLQNDHYQFVVTGSARLDTFRKSGDSLLGRYFLTHLFPISLSELAGLDFQEFDNAQSLIESALDLSTKSSDSDFEQLIKFGGFPEPFFKASESFWRRWSREHETLLLREDLRDLSRIQDLSKIEDMAWLLKESVGSTISYNSIAQNLEVNHSSIKQWLLQLEKIMLCFSIKPWSKKLQRTLRKNPKVYFYNWSKLDDEGARFENFIAMQLYKATTLWRDRFGYEYDLFFIRDYEKNEIDFLISKDKKPWLLVETKLGKAEASNFLKKTAAELKIPALVLSCNHQQVHSLADNITAMGAKQFLQVLP